MLFDTHAHYTAEQFAPDRDELLASLPEKGVSGVLTLGSSLEDSAESLAIAEKFPFVWAGVGVHPESVGCVPDTAAVRAGMERIAALARHEKCVAIGEIGLDYHWEPYDRATQRLWFEAQCALANDLSLPVVVHDREAHGDSLEILKKHRPRGVMHCYSGSPEMAEELLKLGLYISFTGVLTFSNARRAIEACRVIPTDRLLIETDCPYMAPVPYRGKRCDSSMVREVCARMAEVKGLTTEEMARITAENARRLFGIEK